MFTYGWMFSQEASALSYRTEQVHKTQNMKIYTEAVHFDADQKLLEFVEKKLGKLDHYYDRIIDARVHLKLENSGQVKDKIAEVVISVPGDVIVAKESDKTFEAAIDKLVDVLKRQIVKYKDRLRETN